MRSLFVSCALLFSLVFTTLAQTTPAPTAADKEERDKQALALLRETISDVANLRTVENRISFTSELAALMWYYDKAAARALFGSAVGDFKALLLQYDQQMNALGTPAEGENTAFSPMMFGEPTDRARVAAKFQMALAVREQIAMSIAEHEPELAYNFFYDSAASVTNPQFREHLESSDGRYEASLLTAIAKTDAARATAIAIRSPNREVTNHHVELLKQIHDKDPDKGIEYGAVLLSRLKEQDLDDMELWTLSYLLSTGELMLAASKEQNGKPPAYSQSQLREIAEILARTLGEKEPGEYASIEDYIDQIEDHHPGRAAQLRTKFKIQTGTGSGSGSGSGGLSSAPPPPPKPAPAGSGTGSAAASQMADDETDNAADLIKSVAELEDGDLPAEERRRILDQARTIVNKANSREKKIVGLSMLAGAAKRAGDEDLAVEVMREAESLVTQNPKTYQDLIYVWMIISGYAEIRPARSFVLLEDTIFRVNGLIDAFVRIAEFIDVGEQMIVDGEFQVGAFGGGMIRQMTAMSGIADGTLRTLANADMGKMRNAASRFDRPEIRVLAKMMVLRTLLDKPSDDVDPAVEALPEGAVISNRVGP